MCFRWEKFLYWLIMEEDDDELQNHIDYALRINPDDWKNYYKLHIKKLKTVVKLFGF